HRFLSLRMYFCFIVSFLLPTSALRDDHFMPELVQVGDSLHFVKGSNPLLVPEVPEVPEVHGRSAARLFEHLDNSEKPTPLGVTALKNDGFGEQSDESPEDFIHSFDSSEQIQGILAGISDTGSYEIFNSHLQVEDSNRLVESVNFGSKLTGASRWLMKRRHRNRRNFDGFQQGEIQSEKDDTDWYPNFSEAERGEIGENSILAGMIAEFMADSQMQLVVDLDLFRTLFADPRDRFDGSVKTGDDSYVRQLLSYLEPLKEYDISAPCLADIGYFLWSAIEYARSIRESNCLNCSCDGRAHDTKQHQWIFNVVDALGKVPAGILGGNNLWIGSWSACRRISVIKNRQGQRWNGQYCMARFQPFNKDNPLKNIGSSDVPDPTAQCRQSTTVRNSSSNEEEDDNKCFDLIPLLNYGLCTPDSCTAYDTKKIIDFIYKSAEALIGREVVCNVDIVCRNDLPESQMSHDKMSMTVLFFLIFIVILMTFSTLYDCIVYQKELITAADQEAFYDEQNWFVKVLLSFSLYTNGKSILKTDRGAKQIHCLHGTRVLSMFWIILGHTYYYVVTSLTVDNLLPTIIAFPQKFLNLIIVQAPLAVDSFFYLSGMLTSYLFMEKFKIEAAKGKSIFAADMWSLFYIHRYIRLTPIYLVIMILDVTLFTYISDGPFWRSIEANYCRKMYGMDMVLS
uniref:Acyltransferase 3 domain-containing protein n=1 Tax=Parascaris univalens TaxID=6257 RepID=A0A915BWP6_PARUN